MMKKTFIIAEEGNGATIRVGEEKFNPSAGRNDCIFPCIGRFAVSVPIRVKTGATCHS